MIEPCCGGFVDMQLAKLAGVRADESISCLFTKGSSIGGAHAGSCGVRE